MRDIATVKETRDKLRNEILALLDLRRELSNGIMNADEYGKRSYGYLINTVTKMKAQINALEYVLNEDTELEDATEDNHPDRLFCIKNGEICMKQ